MKDLAICLVNGDLPDQVMSFLRTITLVPLVKDERDRSKVRSIVVAECLRHWAAIALTFRVCHAFAPQCSFESGCC